MNVPEPSLGTRTLLPSQLEDTEEWHVLGEWDHTGKSGAVPAGGVKSNAVFGADL